MNSTYPPGLVCLQVKIRGSIDHNIAHQEADEAFGVSERTRKLGEQVWASL